MTLEQRLIALATTIGTDMKNAHLTMGFLDNLNTVDKSSLVAAINELLDNSGGFINDQVFGVATTYSSVKIENLLIALKNELLGGASTAFDTLRELEVALGDNSNVISNLLTAVANKVSFATAQNLTNAQKLQACQNIGVGNYDHDLTTTYITARDE